MGPRDRGGFYREGVKWAACEAPSLLFLFSLSPFHPLSRARSVYVRVLRVARVHVLLEIFIRFCDEESASDGVAPLPLGRPGHCDCARAIRCSAPQPALDSHPCAQATGRAAYYLQCPPLFNFNFS
eukprot:scaffold82734_cov26-Tisochrysis_lutea.AAC.5